MTILPYLGVIGGACSLAGYAPYVIKIIKGEAPPERASWLVWTLSSLLILMSYYALGARATIWVPAAYFLGSSVITALSFKYGRQGWGTLERLILVVVAISSIRWFHFDTPFVALTLTLIIGFIGYIPVMWRVYSNPMTREELDLEGWTLFFVGSVLNLAAVPIWDLYIATLPVLMVVMNGLMFGLAMRNALIQERQAKRAKTE
ncbi:MAG TPA: hypothetical protein VHE10_02875 [Candidatus Paceibacterota bacterium]|nr:hypothetical protein [Candidatus Paceibacterota bacterium]